MRREIMGEDNINRETNNMKSEIDNIQRIIRRIAPYDATVLLTGESGVGKNYYAKMIHDRSLREKESFININCGSIPENLLESELFGYIKGSFTGASDKGKVGLIEMAHKGTLFLDEIGDLPLSMQVKILKVVQDRKYTPIGSLEEKEVDFRLIVATNADLMALVKEGQFRRDLYYRINVISIVVPSLRDRKKDIQKFTNEFLLLFGKKYKKNLSITKEAATLLEAYHWPGNIRELQNFIEGLVLVSDVGVITEKEIKKHIQEKFGQNLIGLDSRSLKVQMEELEGKIIQSYYEKYRSTVKVAKALNISQASASMKIKKYAKIEK